MEYEDFIKHYSKNLQLVDFLDWLDHTTNSYRIPDYLEVDSNSEKTSEESHQTDQDQETSSQDS